MAENDNAVEPVREMAREAAPLREALRRFFRARVPDAAEVDDLVQEVFARIVGRESTWPIEHLNGYVFQTAASVLTDRHRRRSARRADQHILFDAERHGDAAIDPDRILRGKEDLRAVTAALLALPYRTRVVFLRLRLDGCRYREVADQLGISVSAVEKHMVKAIQHLSATFGDRP
jgi:RNA polymerase sigma factor (sigma-70 family)